jgi:hypothetical protein
LTAAAVIYPMAWLTLLATGYRTWRKGWSRLRRASVVACCATIPVLAVVLAKAIWLFPNITR